MGRGGRGSGGGDGVKRGRVGKREGGAFGDAEAGADGGASAILVGACGKVSTAPHQAPS